MATKIASLFVEIGTDLTGLNKGLGETKKGLGDTAKGAGQASQSIVKALDGLRPVGVALAGIGAAGAAGIGMMTTAAADFQSQVALMEVAARASGTAFDDLHDAALAVGGDTRLIGVTATGAADSITALYKAGLSTTEVFGDLNAYLKEGAELGGVLRAAVDLAAASELDMARGAEVVSIAMATYGIKAERASEITDNFVAAADASIASVTDLADAMVNIGPTAAAFGWSLEDVNTALAILSERGIRGAEAGTALKSMMTNIMRDTPDVVAALKDLNVTLYDQDGAMRTLPDIVGQLSTAMAGLSEEQRNQYVQTLAGTYGMKAMNTLLAEGTGGWESMAIAIGNAATAQDVATAKAETLNGKLERLGGAWETLTITMGERFVPAATDVVLNATELVDKFNDLSPATQDAAAGLLGIGTVTAGAAGGFILLVPKIADTVRALRDLNKAAPWLMGGAKAAALPLAAVGAGLLGGNWLSQQMTGQGLAGWFTEADGAARGFARANELAADSWDAQRQAIARAREELEILQGTSPWQPTQEAVDILGVWGAGSGQAIRDAIAERQKLINELSATVPELQMGPSLDELTGAMGRFAGVLDRIDPAVIRARNQAIGEMGTAAQGVADPMYALATAANTVAGSFGELEFTPEVLWSLALASGAPLEPLAELAVKLGIATEAEIAASLETYALIEAFGAGTLSASALASSFDQVGRDAFAAELHSHDLGVAVDELPDNVYMRLEARGFIEAVGAADAVTAAIARIPSSKVVRVHLERAASFSESEYDVPGRASGGYVTEPLTRVGEAGPEIVALPSGSYVFPHEQSRQMAGGGPTNVTFNISGAGDPAAVAAMVERRLSDRGMLPRAALR